ncbi:MAG: PcfB family protein [Mobilitalea sp.]
MQEEVENRTVMLAINSSKLTTRVLKNAIVKALGEMKKRRDKEVEIHHGKQTVKQLVGQNQGVSDIEVTKKNIKSFEKVARKYGVDFAVKKDKTVSPPKYLVFFKARDADALTAAFKEFTAKTLKKENRESVLQKLGHFKELVKNAVVNRTRKKEMER